MWMLLAGCLVVVDLCFGARSSSLYYCSDMNPQQHLDIEQLMGMWYGIEILSHAMDAKHELVYEEGCPILYLSEDTTPTTPDSPLHRDYNYQQNYGAGYGRDRNYDRNWGDEDAQLYTTQNPTSYSGYNNDYNTQQRSNYQRTRYGGIEYNRRSEDKKKLRLLWDESGSETEYTMRYNVSKAGFWISSGPHNGSSLEAKFNHFAGTIQVLKAVGNHMVLVFCHQMPDKQLFSIILSRVQNLSDAEIHGVHNFLNRKGLPTTSIRKVCYHSSSSTIIISSFKFISIILITTLMRLIY